MNSAVDVDRKIRMASRHAYILKAKELLKKNDPKFEFFADLAEREQRGIEKLDSWYPLAQV
jgi:hypothetical protein